MDDPVADYACLPTYKLAQEAKKRLTVVLTGEGGDELFGGYSRYRRAQRPKWLGGRVAEPQTDALLGETALNKWRDASRLERAAPAAHAWRSQALIAHAKMPSALARSESVLRLSWRMAKIYPTGSSAIV
jgi:asparagine synthetase B (glutamine-hydrolysing)